MKAYVKINITLHYESTGLEDGTKYPVSVHRAGTIQVLDTGEGERAMRMIENHVESMFSNMSVKPLTGTHKPDLAAAFGGLQEPTRLEPTKPTNSSLTGDLPPEKV